MKMVKPVAWVDPKYLPRRREGHTNVHLTLEARDVQRCALYTAEQLAEAVSAERERCVDIVANAAPGNDHTLPERDASMLTGLAEDIVEAIRSAAK